MSVTTLFGTPDEIDDAELQFTADGRLRHLLTLRGLDRAHIVLAVDSTPVWLNRHL